MRFAARAAIVAAGWLLVGSPAWSGNVLDRIKRDGILHCAALERPGFAKIADNKPSGRAADLCRDIAVQLLGAGGRYGLALLDLDSDYDRVRSGDVDLAFLEPRVVATEKLDSVLARAGEAYRDAFTILVPKDAAPQTLSDLTHASICFMIGDPVWPLLNREFTSRRVVFRPFGFSEVVEMKDAYNVGRCDAVAGAASALAAISLDGGVNQTKSRYLAESLGADPVYAMVPARDGAWAEWVTAFLRQAPR